MPAITAGNAEVQVMQTVASQPSLDVYLTDAAADIATVTEAHDRCVRRSIRTHHGALRYELPVAGDGGGQHHGALRFRRLSHGRHDARDVRRRRLLRPGRLRLPRGAAEQPERDELPQRSAAGGVSGGEHDRRRAVGRRLCRPGRRNAGLFRRGVRIGRGAAAVSGGHARLHGDGSGRPGHGAVHRQRHDDAGRDAHARARPRASAAPRRAPPSTTRDRSVPKVSCRSSMRHRRARRPTCS